MAYKPGQVTLGNCEEEISLGLPSFEVNVLPGLGKEDSEGNFWDLPK
jgi:hypothetical protein